MAIDPNIIAGLRTAPPVQLPDPMERYGKSLALKNLIGQSDEQEQSRQRRGALQALLATNPDEAALRQAGFLDESLKVGKEGRERAKLDADTGKVTADTAKTNFEVQLKKLEHGASLLDTVKDQQSWEAALRVGEVTGTFGADALAKFPKEYNPKVVDALKNAGITRAQQLTEQTARAGQAVTTRGQDMTAATAAAGQAITTRGQDLTNARGVEANTRQREANAVSAATAALKQRELEGNLSTKDTAHEQAMTSYDTAVSTLDRLEKHPGFQAAVGAGFQKSVMPFIGPTPGTSRAGFMRELETFKAQTFLPMVQQLKGMGALSDAEGQKLSAAVGALSEDMPEKEFKASVKLIKSDLLAAKERASKARSKPTVGAGKKIGGVLTQNEDGSFNYGF